MPATYDYMGLTDLARFMGRSRQRVLQMVNNGILAECGHDVRRIKSRTGNRTMRLMVGIPRNYRTACHCPECGHRWEQDNAIPTECTSCNSKNIETRKAA